MHSIGPPQEMQKKKSGLKERIYIFLLKGKKGRKNKRMYVRGVWWGILVIVPKLA